MLQKCVGEGCESELSLILGWKQETSNVILVWSVIIPLAAKGRVMNCANTCTGKGIYLMGL